MIKESTELTKIYLESYKILLIVPLLLALITLIFSYISSKTDNDTKYVEARYTWDVIKIPKAIDKEAPYFNLEIGVIKPSSIKNFINRDISYFVDKARKNECLITIKDWYQGKFEIIADDNEGLISLNLNNFERQKLENCKNFTFNFLLDLNLDVIDKIITRKNQLLDEKKEFRDNFTADLVSKIANAKDLFDANKIDIHTQKEMIAGVIQNHSARLRFMETEIYLEQIEIKTFEQVPRTLNLGHSYLMDSKKSQNIFISVIIAYFVGLIISILIISILKAQKISRLLV